MEFESQLLTAVTLGKPLVSHLCPVQFILLLASLSLSLLLSGSTGWWLRERSPGPEMNPGFSIHLLCHLPWGSYINLLGLISSSVKWDNNSIYLRDRWEGLSELMYMKHEEQSLLHGWPLKHVLYPHVSCFGFH